MGVTPEEAKELAWAAFLEAVGEPHTPSWRDVGFSVYCTVSADVTRDSPTEHWHVVVRDARAAAPGALSGLVGRIWVAKLNGHCSAWENQDYDPLVSLEQALRDWREGKTELSGAPRPRL
ncbi:MAG TPA: hypothetical protein VF796_08615 [Humisphaera sp.]